MDSLCYIQSPFNSFYLCQVPGLLIMILHVTLEPIFTTTNERIWTYVDLVTNGCEAEEVDDLGGQNESILVRIPPNP